MLATLLLAACALAICGYYLLNAIHKNVPAGAQLPGGPPGKPIVGNLLDIPPKHSWFKFQEWSKEYGSLYRLNLAGQNHVIVSTEEIANDLLRERGTIYSDREQLPMAAQLLSDNLRPLFLPYGETWRNVRKLMHQLANVNVAASYEPVQEEESLRAVRDLCRTPGKYETWFERYSAGLILRLAYSKTVHTGEESFVRRILHVVHTVERVASPGAYLVDMIPALMYLPSFLVPFKREGAQLHKEELTLFRQLLYDGVQASQKGPDEENFRGKWNSNKDSYKLSDDHAAYAIGTLFEAGADTTASAMMSFMLAMTLHPEEYVKLQSEIDAVVGKGRLPLLADMPDLPRVRAVAQEVLRWRPVTAGGLPHKLIRDDNYKMEDGRTIFLPAETNVHAVQWMVHRELIRYPEPESFRPERWLEPGWPTYREPLTQYPNLQNFSAFGFGWRICPGQNVAEKSMYILIARIVWACNLTQKLDASGNAMAIPLYDYVAGFNVQPKPFDFDLKTRHDRQQLLEEQYQAIWGAK